MAIMEIMRMNLVLEIMIEEVIPTFTLRNKLMKKCLFG